jgi:hypothetical protein
LKKSSKAGDSVFKGRSIPVAVLLVFVVLLSAGSAFYAGASFFPQQAPNVTITTTIFTTTTSWTTSTIWSTVTSVVEGIWTTVQYTTSTSTVTITGYQTFGNANVLSAAAGTAPTYYYFQKFTLPNPLTVVKISVYVTAVGGEAKFAIYGDSGNYPGALKCTTNSASPGSTGWRDWSFTSATYVPAGDYWFAWRASGAMKIGYQSTGGTARFKNAGGTYADVWQDPFSSGAAAYGWQFSWYVTGS